MLDAWYVLCVRTCHARHMPRPGHGHDVCEGESLEDDAFVYEFLYDSTPHAAHGAATAGGHMHAQSALLNSCAAAISPTRSSRLIAQTCATTVALAAARADHPLTPQVRALPALGPAHAAASPIHRRALAARTAADENLESLRLLREATLRSELTVKGADTVV
jgi:hypothetical protein